MAGVCSLCVPTSGIIASGAIWALVGLKIQATPVLETTLAHAGGVFCAGGARPGFASGSPPPPGFDGAFGHGVLVSLGKYLAWPWIVLPPFAVFNLFPLLLLAWFYLRDRQARMAAEELVLGWAFGPSCRLPRAPTPGAPSSIRSGATWMPRVL